MTTRRAVFTALGIAVAAVAAFVPRRSPRFARRTPPANRHRVIASRGGRFYFREDLLRSGWYRELRVHGEDER